MPLITQIITRVAEITHYGLLRAASLVKPERYIIASPYTVNEVTTRLVWFNNNKSYQSSVFSYQKNVFVLTDN